MIPLADEIKSLCKVRMERREWRPGEKEAVEDILRAAVDAASGTMPIRVFMDHVGVPIESEADIRGIHGYYRFLAMLYAIGKDDPRYPALMRALELADNERVGL